MRHLWYIKVLRIHLEPICLCLLLAIKVPSFSIRCNILEMGRVEKGKSKTKEVLGFIVSLVNRAVNEIMESLKTMNYYDVCGNLLPFMCAFNLSPHCLQTNFLMKIMLNLSLTKLSHSSQKHSERNSQTLHKPLQSFIIQNAFIPATSEGISKVS